MELPFMTTNGTVGTRSLLLRRPNVALPYVTILGAAAILGTFGNLLVIGTVNIDQKSRNVGNILIVNLAASDMIVTALINPFAILGVVKGKDFYLGRQWLCEMLANLCISSCVCSLFSIGCISINRYVYICHSRFYRRMFTRRRCLMICLGTWVVGILFDLPSHVGWSRHDFDLKTHKCIWDRTFEYSYTVFFVVCGILMPLLLITAFYMKIFFYINNAKKKLSAYKRDPLRKTLPSMVKKAKMMFIIFLSFAFCWTPYSFVLLFDRHDTYQLEVHLYASLAAHLHASLNFIIYGATNTRIRKGYSWFIKRRLFCRSRSLNEASFISEVVRDTVQLDAPKNGQKRERSKRNWCPFGLSKGILRLPKDAKVSSYSNDLQHCSRINVGLGVGALECQEKNIPNPSFVESVT